jgi:beta-galactosidase
VQVVEFHKAKGGLIISFLQNEGSTVLTFDNGLQVVLMDRSAAYKTWQPEMSSDPHSPSDQTVFVSGPYLVRSASRDGKTLALTGDWSSETELEVFNPARCSKLTFNGKEIKVKKTKYGSLVGTLPAANLTIKDMTALLPSMEWKVFDALPERTLSYDDSGPAWVSANKNTTLNPRQPATFPVLYADEYGFHAQNILWRGHFSVADLASAPTGVFLNVIGGTSHGWSAYLNGAFLGSIFGNVSLSDTNRTLAFDGAELKEGENVLFVIQDNMGHDQTTGALNPRGILNATLVGGSGSETTFSSWKVAGKAGGQSNIDPIRGAYNEGGLTAERLGWHLPGLDDGNWQAGSPREGFEEAGAKFYRSVFPLDVPRGYDVSLAFELAPGEERSALRAQLYVNGYMFGK